MKPNDLVTLLADQMIAAGVPPYDAATAHAAVIAHMAYRLARRPGRMLAGRPGYEASETFRHRLRAAASTSAGLLQTVEQYYRHDMGGHRLLAPAERAAIEDKAEARKGAVAKKAERREANESMPHAHQGIAAGARLFAEIRLHGASAVEWECFLHALVRWINHGATLGGATTKGHGRCHVRCAGALSYTPAPLSGSAPPSTALSIDHLGTAYLRHIEHRADAIRERVAS